MKRATKPGILTPRLFKVKEKEAEIQKQILLILKLKNCYPIRFNSGIFFANKRCFRAYILPNGKSEGLPDIQFFKNGVAHFIEVKRPGGKLRPSQETVLADLQQHGAVTMVADSWEKVFDWVNQL